MGENAPRPLLRVALRLALAAYTLVLVIGTHIPQPPDELMQIPGADKSLHFLAYSALALLAALNWFWGSSTNWTRAVWLLAALATFAALDEITQIPVGRQADLRDWLADMSGVLAGVAAVVIGSQLWRRWTNRPT